MSTTRNSLSALYRRLRESVLQRTGSRPKAKHLLLLPPVSGAMQTSFNPPATVEKGNLGRTVLVHGYKDDATVFEPLVKYLSELGLPTYTVTLAPSDASVPLETLAIQLHAYIESNFAANQPLDFVGFSMGGMVVRYYLQRMGGLARTRRFLSVAAPHHGTWTAFTSRLPTAIQLRPNSLFLQDLNADVERLAAIQFASMWTPLDMMIVPSFSSVLPFGENLLVWTLMHKSLITSRRGISAIAQHLLDGYGRVPSPPRHDWEAGRLP
jgi:triacylglycerol lipase